jgi:hypothetical protein
LPNFDVGRLVAARQSGEGNERGFAFLGEIADVDVSRFSVNRNFEGAEFVGKRRS